MVGIVIVTHSNLSESLIKTAEMIVGIQENLLAVSLDASEGLDDLKDKVKKAIDKVSSSEGVLIFTDMFGGSTSIVSSYFLPSGNIEVITGVNLPMLLESILARTKINDVKSLSKDIIEKGKKSIISISDIHKICQ